MPEWIFLALIGFVLGVVVLFVLKSRVMYPEVSFLASSPEIDGMLEEKIALLAPRNFSMSMRMGTGTTKFGAGKSDLPVTYRLAYGEKFLYLYIDMQAADYVCRDRGYQNGDGFVMVLGRLHPWSMTTDDNFVLGFSPQDAEEQAWARKVLWNRDFKTVLAPLGDDVQFAWKKQGGRVGFELLLPWQSVQPFHPWMQGELGFNLTFMKAIENQGALAKIALLDLNLPRGSATKRFVSRLRFKRPEAYGTAGAYLVPRRNHVLDSETLELDAVCWSEEPLSMHVELNLKNLDDSASGLITSRLELPAGLGLRKLVVQLDKPVPPGRYALDWLLVGTDSAGRALITVFPGERIASLESELSLTDKNISQGSSDTLAFRFANFKETWSGAKYHEPLAELAAELDANWRILTEAAAGKDSIRDQGGYLRRAFRSKADGSLQPYSVIVPPALDRGKKYPLLVYLHGSERDDRELKALAALHSLSGFVVMAPKARGLSHFYLSEEARTDVLEAIADACENYPVDAERIVLSGFSMGGYGVYRVFHHAPSRFAALAVFSGTPVVPPYYLSMLKEKGVDYRDEKYLTLFRDIPMFVFHGQGDLNCPFKLTEKLAERLKAQNPRVELRFVDNGHSGMAQEDEAAFEAWLSKFL